MVPFAKKLMSIKPSEDDEIMDTVNQIWKKFDADKSGKLNRRETLKFINAWMEYRGRPSVTSRQFNQFFAKFDVNKDGYISKTEMLTFVKLFMVPDKEDEIIQEMVLEIFMQYDTNNSGYLEKREAFRLVNDVL